MTVGVIIVCYRSDRWLERCLETIGLGEDVRGYLVDNDRVDPELLEQLQARYLSLRYIPLNANVGFGPANNVGIRAALEDGCGAIALVNPDTWFEPDWLAATLAAMDRHGVDLISPLQCDYEGDTLSEWAARTLGLRSADELADEGFRETEWLEGSCIVGRRAVFERLGGFDELFPLYYEDNDLCRRARLVGCRMGVTGAARYHHYCGGSSGGRSPERGARADLGQLLFMLTDARRPLVACAGRGVWWFGRKGYQWISGRNPGFPIFCRQAPAMLFRRFGGILKKRRRDRALAHGSHDSTTAVRPAMHKVLHKG